MVERIRKHMLLDNHPEMSEDPNALLSFRMPQPQAASGKVCGLGTKEQLERGCVYLANATRHLADLGQVLRCAKSPILYNHSADSLGYIS